MTFPSFAWHIIKAASPLQFSRQYTEITIQESLRVLLRQMQNNIYSGLWGAIRSYRVPSAMGYLYI